MATEYAKTKRANAKRVRAKMASASVYLIRGGGAVTVARSKTPAIRTIWARDSIEVLFEGKNFNERQIGFVNMAIADFKKKHGSDEALIAYNSVASYPGKWAAWDGGEVERLSDALELIMRRGA